MTNLKPAALDGPSIQTPGECEWARSKHDWKARAARDGWGARRTMQKKLQA